MGQLCQLGYSTNPNCQLWECEAEVLVSMFSLKILSKNCFFGPILDLGSLPELRKSIFSFKILLKNCFFGPILDLGSRPDLGKSIFF